MTDNAFLFDKTPQSLAAGTADQLSTNVFDAGSAKRLFGGDSLHAPKLQIGAKITAGTGALGLRVRLVGADAANLTGNPEIIADTGVQLRSSADAALAIADMITYALSLKGQRSAKRYYGVIYTQSTADQTTDVTAVITESAQTNMPYKKAAVP